MRPLFQAVRKPCAIAQIRTVVDIGAKISGTITQSFQKQTHLRRPLLQTFSNKNDSKMQPSANREVRTARRLTDEAVEVLLEAPSTNKSGSQTLLQNKMAAHSSKHPLLRRRTHLRLPRRLLLRNLGPQIQHISTLSLLAPNR